MPRVYLEYAKAWYCPKCATAWREGDLSVIITLTDVSEVLQALWQRTSHAKPKGKPRAIAKTPCACTHGSSPCDGGLQKAHLFSIQTHGDHPLVHHPHNTIWVCRKHHRELHRAMQGFDFVQHARRENHAPSQTNILSLAFLELVMQRVRPNLRMAALRVGLLLESRTANRIWDGQSPLEVSLYHKWLRQAGLERTEDLRGVLFTYTHSAYRRPNDKQPIGECRTYSIYPEVLRALRQGRFLEVNYTDLRALMAHQLEQRGKSRAEVIELIRTAKKTKPSHTTLSEWNTRAKALTEHTQGSREAVKHRAD
jgi:hypothetical protein